MWHFHYICAADVHHKPQMSSTSTGCIGVLGLHPKASLRFNAVKRHNVQAKGARSK